MQQIIDYNGIIRCTIKSVSDNKSDWYADISFLTSLIEVDDIYVLWHEFPFKDHLFLTPDNIRIGTVESANYLRVLCHWFSVYVIQIIRHVNHFCSLPIHWTSSNIDIWKQKSKAVVNEEGM